VYNNKYNNRKGKVKMKYKIGEVVQIRKNLQIGKIYYNENSPIGDTLTRDMGNNLGKEATVVDYNEGKYILSVDGRVVLYQTYTDGMLCYPNEDEDLGYDEYEFNPEVEKLMIHLEALRLEKEIDKALDNGDKELFVELTSEYNKRKKFLSQVM
jgi:IDEAL domain